MRGIRELLLIIVVCCTIQVSWSRLVAHAITSVTQATQNQTDITQLILNYVFTIFSLFVFYYYCFIELDCTEYIVSLS